MKTDIERQGKAFDELVDRFERWFLDHGVQATFLRFQESVDLYKLYSEGDET